MGVSPCTIYTCGDGGTRRRGHGPETPLQGGGSVRFWIRYPAPAGTCPPRGELQGSGPLSPREGKCLVSCSG